VLESKAVFFCSVDCQKSVWKVHKKSCGIEETDDVMEKKKVAESIFALNAAANADAKASVKSVISERIFRKEHSTHEPSMDVRRSVKSAMMIMDEERISFLADGRDGYAPCNNCVIYIHNSTVYVRHASFEFEWNSGVRTDGHISRCDTICARLRVGWFYDCRVGLRRT
jgi:hypothetical protein